MVRIILLCGFITALFGCAASDNSSAKNYDANLNSLRESLYKVKGEASTSATALARTLGSHYGFTSEPHCLVRIPNYGDVIVSSGHPLCIPDQTKIPEIMKETAEETEKLRDDLANTLPNFETASFKCNNDIKKCKDFGYGWLNCELTMVVCLVGGAF